MEIRKATHDDVAAIHQLAESWLLDCILAAGQKPEQTGFLISNYSIEKYHDYVDHAEYFWVADHNGEIAAFLLAYSRDAIQPDEIVNSCLRYSVIEDFVLIKQICSSKTVKGVRGAAFALYDKLFQTMPQQYAMAAIVNEPLNTKSIEFHQRAGFEHFWDLEPPADYDGQVRTRSIWYFSKTKHAPCSRMSRNNAEDVMLELVEKEHVTAQLYMHEDNLNWTKVGMLVTFMTALLTAFAILIERDKATTDPWLVAILIIFGVLINIMFYSKILSGLSYFNFHKENIREFDQAQCNIRPTMPRLLKNGTERASWTVHMLKCVPFLSTALWVFCSAVLFMRFILPG